MFTAYVTHTRSTALSPTSSLKKRFASTAAISTSTPVSSPTKSATTVELPGEAAALKDRIRRAYPAKLYTFSLTHMRKLAVPPVEIPKTYRNQYTRSVLVGGSNVPVTKGMSDRAKRRLAVAQVKFKLHNIHEGVVYD